MTDKKSLFVLAFKDFRDEEYFEPKELLEKAGFKIFTASSEKGIAQGIEGGEVNIDFIIDNVKVSDFDVIIFIGGPGAGKNIDNKNFQRLAIEAVKENKVLAAICIASAILAKAGVLKNKKATVWSSSLDKSAVSILQESGAEYVNKPVVVDGKIITANGPRAATEFANKIIEIV